MFVKSSYLLVIISIGSGLLSLLGSVGIFVSLIVQRRVERLQEILEELVDQTYQENTNLTGKIFQLINRYQMHYLLPDGPSRTILWYINLTIGIVILLWVGLLALAYQPPWQPQSFLYLLPILAGLVVMTFFRRLLKNAINPLDNRLLNAIIPPPFQLRSVSFLSRYVNISVKSLLKQARLNLVVRKSVFQGSQLAEVVLKEELSFDDFFYYLVLEEMDTPRFLAFGQLIMRFPEDPVTGKPVPVQRNVNITLGFLPWQELDQEVAATLLIFTHGEKNPIQYIYRLFPDTHYYATVDQAECTVNQRITYKIHDNKINILSSDPSIPFLKAAATWFTLDGKRRYTHVPPIPEKEKDLIVCDIEVAVL